MNISEEEITISISPNANPVQKPIGHQISLVCSIKKTDSNGEKPGMIWKKHGGLDRYFKIPIFLLNITQLMF